MGGNSASKRHIQPRVWGMSTRFSQSLEIKQAVFCMLSMLISDSRFDLVWFRLSCDHGWIRSGSVNVRKQQQQQHGTGLPKPSRETKFSGTSGDRGIFIFPCSADHEQDGQPYPVDPYSCYSSNNVWPYIMSGRSPVHSLYLSPSLFLTFSVFRKNLNASKPSNYQSKGLRGNNGCRDKNSTVHGIKRVPQWNHIGSRV